MSKKGNRPVRSARNLKESKQAVRAEAGTFGVHKPATAHETSQVEDPAGSERFQAGTALLNGTDSNGNPGALVANPTEIQLREVNERLIIAAVRAQASSEDAEKKYAELSHVAAHDGLTGLPNRSLLMQHLVQTVALAHRKRKIFALMFVDLDHFKTVNDTLGHPAGDKLLQSIAKRLQACVRGSDIVSRHGGDEFVVLLAEIRSADDAARIAKKLVDSVAAPHDIDGQPVKITVSVGVSVYPDDGDDVEALIDSADAAMYYAKEHGRNGYQLYNTSLAERELVRQSMEQALQDALTRGEFELHYQPKVNLSTFAVTGAEALLRWRREESKYIPALEFMSVAENCGLIRPIGKWVLHEACRQAATWSTFGLGLGQIAVNVSAIEFHDPGFVPSVIDILKETGLDPRLLELDLKEDALLRDTASTAAALTGLQAIGVKVAIDDFGTGTSSLSALARFRVDTLKIDASLTQCADGEPGRTIVGAIIAIGMNLNQRIVAEGIESEQQLEFLNSHGCAEGQGYLFSCAVSPMEFASLIANRTLSPTISLTGRRTAIAG